MKNTLPEALLFETGANRWRSFDLPPANTQAKSLYFHAMAVVWMPVQPVMRLMRYVSDPAKPVPYTAGRYQSLE